MRLLAGLFLLGFAALLIVVLILRGPRSYNDVELRLTPLRGTARFLLLDLLDEDERTTAQRLKSAVLDALPVEPPSGYETVLAVQVTRRWGRREWGFSLPPWKDVLEPGESFPSRITYRPPPNGGWVAQGFRTFVEPSLRELPREEAAAEFVRILLMDLERFRSSGRPTR